MPTYIALLRGINVSGQKKILMAELRTQTESLGFENVKTYIQSGNLFFDTKEKSESTIADQIKTMIKKHWGFEVPIIIRTPAQLKKVIKKHPYLKEDEKRVAVSFLSAKPTKAAIAAALEWDSKNDVFEIHGKDVYLFCPNGFGTSKLTNNFFERKLKVEATTRNLRSVNKLIAIAEGQ